MDNYIAPFVCLCTLYAGIDRTVKTKVKGMWVDIDVGLIGCVNAVGACRMNPM